MWRKILIKFLFPKQSDSQAGASAETAKAGSAAVRSSDAAESPQQPVDLDVEQCFVGMILSTKSFLDAKLSRIEKITLQRLEELASAETFDEQMVPRLPAVVPQLLSSLKSDDSSGKHIAEQIGRDPVLVGEVIRIVNSAYYQTSQKINNLERAVVIIGRTGLQRLVASVVMKPIFNVHQGRFGQHAAGYLWSQSERCALACAYLARGRCDPFDAYLAGMVRQIGMIVAVRILDQTCKDKNQEVPQSLAFYQALLTEVRTLSVCVARNWQFPEDVLAALEEQISQDRALSLPTLSNLLYIANRISQVHVLVEAKCLPDDLHAINQRLGGALSEREFRCYAELTRIAQSEPS